jgi:hypothetical protein
MSLIIGLLYGIWILIKIYDILIIVAIILLLVANRLNCLVGLKRFLMLHLPCSFIDVLSNICWLFILQGELRSLLLKLQERSRWEILEGVVGAELVIVVDVGHAIDEAAGPYIWSSSTKAGYVAYLLKGTRNAKSGWSKRERIHVNIWKR